MLFVFGKEFQNTTQGYNQYMKKKIDEISAKQKLFSSAKYTIKKIKRQDIVAIYIFQNICIQSV